MTAVAYPNLSFRGLTPLCMSSHLMTCLSMCIIVPLLPYSADTAICLLYPRFVLCGIQPKRYFRHCGQAASLPTTFVPLFCPAFFLIEPFQSNLFLPCEFSVMLRRSCPSCVAAVAVTNKIVRNLPFSSSLSFFANNKKSIADDFHGASHMVPHPCF